MDEKIKFIFANNKQSVGHSCYLCFVFAGGISPGDLFVEVSQLLVSDGHGSS